jgi:hypothetical protein
VLNSIGHPSELIDVICVADLGAWTLVHWVECPWLWDDDFREFRRKAGALPDGGVTTGFFRYVAADFQDRDEPTEAPNPIAVLVAELLKRLAWDDPDLLPIADYFSIARITASGTMTPRLFGLDVLSQDVQERLRNQGPSTGPEAFWDPWYGMLGGPQ